LIRSSDVSCLPYPRDDGFLSRPRCAASATLTHERTSFFLRPNSRLAAVKAPLLIAETEIGSPARLQAEIHLRN
jgi:hypothetical protein